MGVARGWLATIALVGVAAVVGWPANAESVSNLKTRTHIHGLAVDREDPSRLLIATHHGLMRAGPDGKSELISVVQDFMGFTSDPSGAANLFASGHPAGGGNLGFIASTDNGATWTQVSPGAGGPVDFHQMTVSHADPKVIYGSYGDLQVSKDAGKSWMVVGPSPQKLIDLAASAEAADRLYAATEDGLFVSADGGLDWKPLMTGAPVSLVEVMPDGTLYAFVVGRGLLRATEANPDFAPTGGDWNGRILLHMAADSTNPKRLFAASHRGEVLASTDGGASWSEVGSGS